MEHLDDFASYAFLSKEADHVHMPEAFASSVSLIRELSRVALAEARALPAHATNGSIAGFVLWIRAVESAQAALILADRGLEGPAMGSARLAWECLFYAGALWKQPELAERMGVAHEHEKVKQAEHMLRIARHRLSTSELLAVEAAIAAPIPARTQILGVLDAARIAGLEDMYAIHFRGLSNAGSHGTWLSLNRYVAVAPGEVDITLTPHFKDLPAVLNSIGTCLNAALEKLREHAGVNFSPPPSPK